MSDHLSEKKLAAGIKRMLEPMMNKKISDLCEVIGGFAFQSSSMKSDKGRYQIIKMSNLYKGTFDLNRNPSFFDEIEPRHLQYLLKEGDVIMTLTGTIGKKDYGYSVQIENQTNLLLNQRVCLLRPKSGRVNGYYLLQLLRSKKFLDQFFGSSIGGTGNQSNVSINFLKDITVVLPEIRSQVAIASLLSTWDQAIEKTELVITAKEKSFTALTQKLIHNCVVELKHFQLKDICEPVTCKNIDNELNVLTTSAQYGLVSQLDYYNKSVSAEDVRGYYLLKNGEFAYNRSSSNGYPYGAIKRLEEYPQGVLSTLYLCFSIKNDAPCDSDFMAHAFEAGLLNKQLAEVCQEGARSHGLLNITKSDFFGLKMFLPTINSQKQIAEILNTARQEIDLLKKQAEAYRKQKRGLMQKLLTGKWRIKTTEEANS